MAAGTEIEKQINKKKASLERHKNIIERLNNKPNLTHADVTKLKRELYWARKVKKDIDNMENFFCISQ